MNLLLIVISENIKFLVHDALTFFFLYLYSFTDRQCTGYHGCTPTDIKVAGGKLQKQPETKGVCIQRGTFPIWNAARKWLMMMNFYMYFNAWFAVCVIDLHYICYAHHDHVQTV